MLACLFWRCTGNAFVLLDRLKTSNNVRQRHALQRGRSLTCYLAVVSWLSVSVSVSFSLSLSLFRFLYFLLLIMLRSQRNARPPRNRNFPDGESNQGALKVLTYIIITHCVLRFTHCLLRCTHYVLRFSHSVLRFTHCILRFTHCALRFTHCIVR